jgi:hypothetical protein
MTMDESIERLKAKRKTALVIKTIQGKTTVAEASWSFDLSPSEIKVLIGDSPKGREISRPVVNRLERSTGNKYRYQAC